MHKSAAKVSPDDTVKTAMRLMLNLGMDGLPVCENNKYLGSISEADILQHLYPSIQEFMTDPYMYGFEDMETNMRGLFPKKVKNYMDKKFLHYVVRPETTLLHVQSIMMNKGVSHLPVVDKDGNLVGIVSQGDIFKGILGSEIPHDDSAEFHDWAANHYDLAQTWDKRLEGEIPSLKKLFTKEGVKKIADIGSGTGEHVIALAREGFSATGIDRSERLTSKSLEKRFALSTELKHRVSFINGDYFKVLRKKRDSFDGVIMMGNMLSHYEKDWKEVLDSIHYSLKSGGTLFLQLTNYESVFSTKKRVVRFSIAPSRITKRRKYAFITFYDNPKELKGNLLLNMAVMGHDGLRWSQKSINSMVVKDIRQATIEHELKKKSFKNIHFYGSNYGEPLFNTFKPREHDWLNVVTKK